MLGHALEELIDLVARRVRRDVNLNTRECVHALRARVRGPPQRRRPALLIRLASRSRHRRDSAMSQRYTSINAHLRKAPAFAQPIIEHLREVAHAACPEMSGTSRRRT